MLTTAKYTCRQLAVLIQKSNISHAVLCPGTRDTPIIMALNRTANIKCDIVIDERSAAFTALGIASITDSPVALVCTSGTAPLNFAPAIAEAYYRNIPLIVITADRPSAWIDQDDSQTIRQPGIYTNYIKRQYTLPDNPTEPDLKWMVNRSLNDGLWAATTAPAGPVHFNIEIGEPISAEAEIDDEDIRQINYTSFIADFPTSQSREIAQSLADKRVLIVAGFNKPDYHLNRALTRLATVSNVAILAEATANIQPSKGIVTAIDPTLIVADKQSLRPDVVITLGGSIVSRNLKETIRRWGSKHWYVGVQDHTIDCYQSLDTVFNIEPRYFFQKLAPSMQRYSTGKSDYRDRWLAAQQKALDLTAGFDAQWSDMLAINMISHMIPRDYNIAVSNGMTLRHLLATPPDVHRLDCNRGVSGIDGSTSTAIGASSAYNNPTMLITGDMSAQYDMGALASPLITPRFKMVVINNGEGNIFRVIKTTRALPELDTYMASSVNLPLAEIARAYGFNVLEATTPDSLKKSFRTLLNDHTRPTLLIIKTDPRQSAAEYLRYINYLRQSR
ncbi:MAG: 2-succinyl-5-enolpyruvyl-6-hydroxy-3-cyclohexene-1-carboxylic-acid synthase [Muribaculaceae bacterium]|nr:2-succinyl-5-enolpyruvyl-6-hydroxy-3-cyclohexene-1-carboxylic-acid synthase [Muribaculaceae bacterium]